MSKGSGFMYILQLEAVSLGEKSISVMLKLIHFIDYLPAAPAESSFS